MFNKKSPVLISVQGFCVNRALKISSGTLGKQAEAGAGRVHARLHAQGKWCIPACMSGREIGPDRKTWRHQLQHPLPYLFLQAQICGAIACARIKITQDEPGQTVKAPGLVQLREHPIQPVQVFAGILKQKNTTITLF